MDYALLPKCTSELGRIGSSRRQPLSMYIAWHSVGLLHRSLGEEAVAPVAAWHCVTTITLQYHPRARATCWPGRRQLMPAGELCGRVGGYCAARAAACTRSNRSWHLGAFGLVGGGFGFATGAALSAKKHGSGWWRSAFGDGAANQGIFMEY